MSAPDAIRRQVRTFILETFLPGAPESALVDSASLSDDGTVDSTGVLDLIAFLETCFDIAVRDEELLPDNLDSVDRLCAYVRRKGAGDAG
jgi:acyl carrier protein